MRSLIGFVVSLSFVSLAACSSGSSDSKSGSASSASSSADSGSFCAAICKRQAGCDSSVDVQTCTSDCENGVATTVQKLRSDVIEEIQSCYTGYDCKTLLGGDAMSSCIDEAAVDATPSQAAKDFCDAYISAANRCDASISKAKCLSDVELYSDETLADAAKCTKKSCSVIDDCVNSELGLSK